MMNDCPHSDDLGDCGTCVRCNCIKTNFFTFSAFFLNSVNLNLQARTLGINNGRGVLDGSIRTIPSGLVVFNEDGRLLAHLANLIPDSHQRSNPNEDACNSDNAKNEIRDIFRSK